MALVLSLFCWHCFQGQGGTFNHKICWVLYSHILFLCISGMSATDVCFLMPGPDWSLNTVTHPLIAGTTASFSDMDVHNWKTAHRGPSGVSHCIDTVSKNSINSEEGRTGGLSLTQWKNTAAAWLKSEWILRDSPQPHCPLHRLMPTDILRPPPNTTHWCSLTATAALSGCCYVVDMQPKTSSRVINLAVIPPVLVKILLLATWGDFPGKE